MEKKELAEMLHHVKIRREDQESNRFVWKNKIAEAEKSQFTLDEKTNLLHLKSELEAIEFDLKQHNNEYDGYAAEILDILKDEGFKALESMKFEVGDTDDSHIEVLYDEDQKVFVNGPISRINGK